MLAEPTVATRPQRPIRYIETDRDLAAACAQLADATVVALDVETTLFDRELCLIQLAVPDLNIVIDARAITDLDPLADILESPRVVKVIHNASFERSVLARSNIDLVNVFDTLTTSRKLRGRNIDGGHGLAAVCQRELGRILDKSAQTSDWTRRPLTDGQVAYAALDVEVLVDLHDRFNREMLL